MRKVLYAALLIPLFFVPLKRVNIANLLPVEAVAIYMDEDQVVLETDTGNIGVGATAEMALKNLKENTPAVVYLDTAQYLLIAPEAEDAAKELYSQLKPSAKVCVCEGAGRVKILVKYLEIRKDLPTLKCWKNKN